MSFAPYILLVGSTPVKYIFCAVAGLLLAIVLNRTFGPVKWLGPAATLTLMGFFLYGVLYQHPAAFYVAFGAFFFAATTTLSE